MVSLKDIKREKLAEWFSILNGWKWPEGFIYEKPSGWEDMREFKWDDYAHPGTKEFYISSICREIKSIIGMKEILRYHHLKNIISYNWQFEIWWIVNKINGFGQRRINSNFYINIYTLLGWRKNKARQ